MEKLYHRSLNSHLMQFKFHVFKFVHLAHQHSIEDLRRHHFRVDKNRPTNRIHNAKI